MSLNRLILFPLVSLLFLSSCASSDYQDPYDEGYDIGYDVGKSAGYEEGYFDGHEEGFQEGESYAEDSLYASYSLIDPTELHDSLTLLVSAGSVTQEQADLFLLSVEQSAYHYGLPLLPSPTPTSPPTLEPTPTPLPEPTATAVPQSKNSYTVYITETGEKYHSYGCQYLRQSCISIDIYDAISRGYTSCSKCNP